MASTKFHFSAAAIGLVVLAGAAWWWQNKVPAVAATSPSPGPATSTPGRAGAGAGGVSGGPAPVEVGRVEAQALVDDVSAVGSLRSRQGVMLRPEVSGRIAKVAFEAQASIARTNLQRSRELLAQSFVSQSAVDQNAAALEVAEAQVALAKAQLMRMQVSAPFDATAGIRLVNVGDYVKDGADLVNVEDMSSMAVDFRLPERYLPRVRAGQPVEVAVDALPDQLFKGRVEAVDSQVDANGRSLLVRAQVENPGAVLRPGMFARPRLVFSVRDAALVIPEEALTPQGAKQFVFKVVDSAGGKVSQRLEIKTGLRLPGKVEVLGGLAPGDLVVTAGQARLMRGESQPVRLVDLDRIGQPRTPGNGDKPGRAASGGAGPSPAASGAAVATSR